MVFHCHCAKFPSAIRAANARDAYSLTPCGEDSEQRVLYPLRACPDCGGTGIAGEPGNYVDINMRLPSTPSPASDGPRANDYETPVRAGLSTRIYDVDELRRELHNTQRAYEAAKKRAEKAEHERDEARAVTREHQESAVRFATERDAALDRIACMERHVKQADRREKEAREQAEKWKSEPAVLLADLQDEE